MTDLYVKNYTSHVHSTCIPGGGCEFYNPFIERGHRLTILSPKGQPCQGQD